MACKAKNIYYPAPYRKISQPLLSSSTVSGSFGEDGNAVLPHTVAGHNSLWPWTTWNTASVAKDLRV